MYNGLIRVPYVPIDKPIGSVHDYKTIYEYKEAVRNHFKQTHVQFTSITIEHDICEICDRAEAVSAINDICCTLDVCDRCKLDIKMYIKAKEKDLEISKNRNKFKSISGPQVSFIY